MRADFSKGCIVYVDESGSFAERKDDYSSIGALIVPSNPKVRKAIDNFVVELDKEITPKERIKGEPKGCKLHSSRYDKIIRFVCEQGFVFCTDAVCQKDNNELAGFESDAQKAIKIIQQKSAEIKQVDKAQRYIKAFESASRGQRLYAGFVNRVFCRYVVQELCFRLPDRIEIPDRIDIVFDPKDPAQAAMWEFSVYLAFTTRLYRCLRRPIAATLGSTEAPWHVRQKTNDDESGLLLVDWLTYPYLASLRPDLPEKLRNEYKKIQELYKKYKVNDKTYDFGIDSSTILISVEVKP